MKYLEITFKISTSEDVFFSARDILADASAEAGFESFEETPDGLKGYVQQSLFNEAVLTEIINDFPFENCIITYNVKEAEYKNWNEAWENEGFMPILIGDRCAIHDGVHLPEISTAVRIEIKAKQAFGTGNHETTQMILEWITEKPLDGCAVLDCGTGTGVLSIAAIKQGADFALAYDIDEWSTDNAIYNATINGVENRMKCLLGDVSVLKDVNSQFDVALANINRNIILNDMDIIAEKIKDKGELILSGFYSEDSDIIINKAGELGLELTDRKIRNNWTALRFTKTSGMA